VQTSFDNDGFDPFVMSRAIPSGANVMNVASERRWAVVQVNRFLMTPQYNPLSCTWKTGHLLEDRGCNHGRSPGDSGRGG
jgi:hypothetical protein